MATKPTYPLKIFYDGSCPLCRTKMEFYLRKEHGGKLLFVDFTAPEFNPAPFAIPLADFMYELHAIDETGTLYRGVDAFRAIWQALSLSAWYSLLGFLIGLPVIHLAAGLIYRAIAETRRHYGRI